MAVPDSNPRACFQCRRRRIVCDGGTPICRKCIKKGLECSGPSGIRFSTGVASRGKLKGSKVPVLNVSAESIHDEASSVSSLPPIRWKMERTKVVKRTSKREKSKGPETARRLSNAAMQSSNFLSPVTTKSDEVETEIYGQNEEDLDHYLTLISCDDLDQVAPQSSQQNALACTQTLRPWIAPLHPRVRAFFSHFSEAIAPVMVLLDISNGYRELILPMACEDTVLRQAVGVVVAQHLSMQQPNMQAAADVWRTSVISRLLQDSQRNSLDRVFNVSTWATLIVLLVGETVTGSSEYIQLLRILMSFCENINHANATPLERFLVRQTHMFEFMGFPFLGQSHGVSALRKLCCERLDWLDHELPPESQYNNLIHMVKQIFLKGSEIYLHRANTNETSWELLEEFRHLTFHVQPESIGAHTLVWACFIAAADSTDPFHREYFKDYMIRVYSQTLFRNIPAAVESLPTIWQHQGTRKWTEDITSLSPILIM